MGLRFYVAVLLVVAIVNNMASGRKRDFGVCNQRPETGRCRAAILKHYYDAMTKQCDTFLWGGCGGNSNRFDSWEECWNKCGKKRKLRHQQYKI